MLKIILRIMIILAVFTLVAGGIYLLVQNSGTNLLGSAQVEGGFHAGNGTRPEGGNFDKGQPPADGDFKHGGDDGGFSSRNLSELGVNIGKVALITIGVILVQGLIRFFRRRKNTVDSSAA
ncbi:hypothetical protein EG832_04435 [bacterium]|nr:hypothetical protein [bacterium]